ncbi:hypothetical protein KEM55_000705, partial [Ascosphaera atra]
TRNPQPVTPAVHPIPSLRPDPELLLMPSSITITPADGMTSISTSSSVSDVPAAVLRAELERRGYGLTLRDDAGDGSDGGSSCGSIKTGTYNMTLHVLALFLILAISTLGDLRIPLDGTALPPPPDPAALPLPFAPLRHRRAHRYGLRAPVAYGFHLAYEPMSAGLLE